MELISRDVKMIGFAEEEKKAFRIVERVLSNFQILYDEKDVLESVTTGECIQIKELRRIRGVLGFFYDEDRECPTQLYTLK